MEPLHARVRPFDDSGCVRHADGIVRYEHRPQSLVEMLRSATEGSPRETALIEVGGARLSYTDLWERAARVAGGLRQLGVGRGDRVAIRLSNSIDWCLAFFGIQMLGAIAVPVNTRFTDAEASYVLTDSGSRFVFVQGQPLPDESPVVDEAIRARDVAAIFYTSGTTGFSKGAMLTHEGFLSNTETCRRVGLLPRGEPIRNLVSVPLFHVTGCNSQLLPTCEAGGTTVIMRAFDVRTFLATLERERIDATLAVPAIYWRAMNDPEFGSCDTASVRWLGYGGAPIAPDLVARVLETFPNARISNAFGLTETSSVATCLPHEFARLRPDSVGLAAPVVDLALRASDGELGAAALPEIGELLVRGPNVVSGYWNKPEATAEAFADGWLHTGDVARIDADGFVQILDRQKDMINRGGEKVYCVEVESALVAHPAVFEAAVIGVPDEMMGEKVGAVIVLKPGQSASIEEILESVRGRLARFKIPQYAVIQSDLLPRNPGGKILKKTLRQTVQWGSRTESR